MTAPPDPLFRPAGDPRRLAFGVTAAAALEAALDSGLLATLETGQPLEAHSLAHRAHLDPRAVSLVLEALGWMGVVTNDGPRWSLTEPVGVWKLWFDNARTVTELLETGRPARRTHRRDEAEDAYAQLAGLIGRFSQTLVTRMAPDLVKPGGSVLELAAGAAPWTRALLALEPTMTATVLDLPGVIGRTRPLLAADGLDDRVRFVGADLFDVSLEGRHDLVIVASACRLFAESDNRRLFEQARAACADHGELVIIDAVDDPELRGPELALYELSLATRSEVGRPWTLDHYRTWLADAGFEPPEATPGPGSEASVLRARPGRDRANLRPTGV